MPGDISLVLHPALCRSSVRLQSPAVAITWQTSCTGYWVQLPLWQTVKLMRASDGDAASVARNNAAAHSRQCTACVSCNYRLSRRATVVQPLSITMANVAMMAATRHSSRMLALSCPRNESIQVQYHVLAVAASQLGVAADPLQPRLQSPAE